MRNLRIRIEECRKIIRRLTLDIGIKAAVPLTGMQNIPQGNVMILQNTQALLISNITSGTKQCTHNRPEQVARMSVILIFS